MEKFYEVTPESKLYQEYMDYHKNSQEINKLIVEFFKANEIETSIYMPTNSKIYIEPTENDILKFNQILCQPIDNNIRAFKKSSNINKQWLSILKENNLVVLSNPQSMMTWFYFKGVYQGSTRLFKDGDKVYCSVQSQSDFTATDGIIEMAGSEFYKIIEERKIKLG